MVNMADMDRLAPKINLTLARSLMIHSISKHPRLRANLMAMPASKTRRSSSNNNHSRNQLRSRPLLASIHLTTLPISNEMLIRTITAINTISIKLPKPSRKGRLLSSERSVDITLLKLRAPRSNRSHVTPRRERLRLADILLQIRQVKLSNLVKLLKGNKLNPLNHKDSPANILMVIRTIHPHIMLHT